MKGRSVPSLSGPQPFAAERESNKQGLLWHTKRYSSILRKSAGTQQTGASKIRFYFRFQIMSSGPCDHTWKPWNWSRTRFCTRPTRCCSMHIFPTMDYFRW